MLLNTFAVIMAVYGLWFYIQGCQDLSPDIRKSWAPQDIEDFMVERDQERYFGQIILMLVAMYLIILII